MRTREVVPDDSGSPTSHFTERLGYTLTLEQGIVTIQHPKMALGRLVPLSNVAFLVPAAAAGKVKAA